MDETDLMIIAEPEEFAVTVVLIASAISADEDADWAWRRRRDETQEDMP